MRVERITKEFDVKDIKKITIKRPRFRRLDDRRNKRYGSSLWVGARIDFQAILGRNDEDYEWGLETAIEVFEAKILQVLDLPYGVSNKRYAYPLRNSSVPPNSGYWLGVELFYKVDRPKNILGETEWLENLSAQVIEEALLEAADAGIRAMAEYIQA